MDLSPSQQDIVTTNINVSASLSITAVIATLVLIRWLRFENKFLIYIKLLLLSDLGYAICSIAARNMDKKVANDTLCSVMMATSSFFSINSIYWALSFAINTYLVIVKDKDNVDSFFKKHVIAALSLSLAIALIPITFGGYGVSYISGCGINKELSLTTGAFIRLGLHYVPIVSAAGISAILYRLSILKLARDKRSRAFEQEIRGFARQFVPYQLVPFVCGFPGLVGEIIQITKSGEITFFLVLLSNFAFRFQGFLNSLIYGLSRGVRESVRLRIRGEAPSDGVRLSIAKLETLRNNSADDREEIFRIDSRLL